MRASDFFLEAGFQGHELRGGAGKSVDVVFPGRPRRASGINAHQWTTAAQDDVKWHKTAE